MASLCGGREVEDKMGEEKTINARCGGGFGCSFSMEPAVFVGTRCIRHEIPFAHAAASRSQERD